MSESNSLSLLLIISLFTLQAASASLCTCSSLHKAYSYTMSSSQALFGDDSEGEEDELRVNQTFAKAYQSRKQQEELRNYQDNEDDDDSSSASSSEDEDGNLLSPSMDVSILRTIHALRNKDEKIYDPSSRFFPEQNALKVVKEEKRKKPKRFKDVMREEILEQMNQEEKDEDSVAEEVETENPLEYDREQKALRSAFLESTQEDEDEEADWMMVKKKGPDTKEEDGVEELYQQELQALEKTAGTPLQDPRGEVEDGDKFLLDFLKNKKWIDKEADRDNDSLDEKNGNNGNESDDSMHDLDKADEFESKYNFRFEEAEAAAGTSGADFSVIGYARGGTMNTLRRKDDSRKRKRLERKERKAAERKAKEEQLRRLKNAKREEMEAKLKQIKSVLGQVEERGKAVDEATMLKLMEGDYDPEEFEKMMNEAYGDDFYQQEDAEWKTDTDVRESLLKDEDGNMIVGQDDVEGGLYDNVEDDDEYDHGAEGDAVVDENEDWNEADEYEGEEAFVDDTEHEETETEKKLKEKMMDELYKLDYEDIIAGMPTRFKYRTVEKNDYGLTPEEILFARDSTLKSYVSLKKMAPYREDVSSNSFVALLSRTLSFAHRAIDDVIMFFRANTL